jgi:hypothetical protein
LTIDKIFAERRSEAPKKMTPERRSEIAKAAAKKGGKARRGVDFRFLVDKLIKNRK